MNAIEITKIAYQVFVFFCEVLVYQISELEWGVEVYVCAIYKSEAIDEFKSVNQN